MRKLSECSDVMFAVKYERESRESIIQMALELGYIFEESNPVKTREDCTKILDNEEALFLQSIDVYDDMKN